MSTRTFEEAQESRAKRGYELKSLIKLTRSYQQFRNENLERIKLDAEFFRQMGMGGCFSDTEHRILKEFYATEDGMKVLNEIQGRMKLSFSSEAVRLVSRSIAGVRRKPLSTPYLDDSFLTFKVDLSQSKDVIEREFKHILDFYHKHYQQRAYPPIKSKERSRKIRKPEDIDKMIHAYELVEKHQGNIPEAAKELFPEISDSKTYLDADAKAKIQQVRRWHGNIKDLIQDL